MKVLLCSLLVFVGASGSLLGSNRCTWGPSYWCKDFKSAASCSAVQHCTNNVWKVDQVSSVDDSDICQFCEDIISDVKKFILSNATRATIENYMKTACSLLPDTYSQKECNDITEHYLDEFTQMIEAGIDPKKICTLIRLCSKGTTTPAVKTTTTIQHVSGFIECDACKAFVSYLKDDLDKSATQAQILQAAKAECAKLGGDLATECSNLVEQYLPDIINVVEQNLDTMCVTLGMCDSETGQLVVVDYQAVTVTAMRELRIDQQIKKLSSSLKLGQDFCTTCEEIFGYIRIFMDNNATMMEMEDLLKNDVCPQLKEFTSECQMLVTQYFPKIWTTLMSYLEPAAVCQELHLCNTSRSVAVAPFSSPAVNSAAVDSSVFCPICEFVIHELDQELSDNATKAEIEAAVEKVCTILPATIRNDCEQFIQQYGDEIIEALAKGASPGVVCTLIGLCESPHRQAVNVLREEVVSANCVACEMVLSYCQSRLKENATAQEIEQEVEELCKYLASDIVSQCQEIVRDAMPLVMVALKNDEKPKEICTELGMCVATVNGLVNLMKGRKFNNW